MGLPKIAIYDPETGTWYENIHYENIWSSEGHYREWERCSQFYSEVNEINNPVNIICSLNEYEHFTRGEINDENLQFYESYMFTMRL